MSRRRWIWLLGSIALAALTSVCVTNRELRFPLALLTVGLCALMSEIVEFVLSFRVRPTLERPEDAKPADGIVDLAAIESVHGTPSSIHPVFRRFDGLLERHDAPIRSAEPTPALLGRVVMIAVFVGRDGVAWSDREIATGLEAIERAGVWLEREAIRLEAPVNLFVAETYFQVDLESDEVEVEFSFEGDDVGPMEGNATTKAVVMASRAAAILGFSDASDWMTRINQRIEADATAWLFLDRRAGRSLAIPAELSGLPGVGFAVCHASEASFPEPLRGKPRIDASTVAHELLHLFGASDKYGVTLKSFPAGSVTSREIMRLNHESLFRMTIDPMTAVEVGWPVDLESAAAKKIATAVARVRGDGGRWK